MEQARKTPLLNSLALFPNQSQGRALRMGQHLALERAVLLAKLLVNLHVYVEGSCSPELKVRERGRGMQLTLRQRAGRRGMLHTCVAEHRPPTCLHVEFLSASFIAMAPRPAGCFCAPHDPGAVLAACRGGAAPASDATESAPAAAPAGTVWAAAGAARAAAAE